MSSKAAEDLFYKSCNGGARCRDIDVLFVVEKLSFVEDLLVHALELEGQDPQMCTFGLSGCRVRPPEREKRHEKTTREKNKSENGSGRGKKARHFGPPTLRAPPFGAASFGARPSGARNLRGPTLRDPPFGAATFRAPPFGAPPFGAHPFDAPPLRGSIPSPSQNRPHPDHPPEGKTKQQDLHNVTNCFSACRSCFQPHSTLVMYTLWHRSTTLVQRTLFD